MSKKRALIDVCRVRVGSSVDVYFVGGYCWWAEPQAAEAALDGSGYTHCIVALSCILYHIYATFFERPRVEGFARARMEYISRNASVVDARLLLCSLPPLFTADRVSRLDEFVEDLNSEGCGMLRRLARTPSTHIARRPAALRRFASTSPATPEHSIYISNSTDPYFNLSFEDWFVNRLYTRVLQY